MNGFMAARRFVKPLLFAAIPVAAIAALVAFWNWNWFIPIVQGRASSALGRAVTIEHLHVQLGRATMVSAYGVRIANPADFPEQGDFARIARLSVQADVMAYIQSSHTCIRTRRAAHCAGTSLHRRSGGRAD
jgi:hypothetical protein